MSICTTIADNGLVRLPGGTLVKVNGGKEIYKIDQNFAYPFANYNAFLKEAVTKKLYTISIKYLHTYSRGGLIE